MSRPLCPSNRCAGGTFSGTIRVVYVPLHFFSPCVCFRSWASIPIRGVCFELTEAFQPRICRRVRAKDFRRLVLYLCPPSRISPLPSGYECIASSDAAAAFAIEDFVYREKPPPVGFVPSPFLPLIPNEKEAVFVRHWRLEPT